MLGIARTNGWCPALLLSTRNRLMEVLMLDRLDVTVVLLLLVLIASGLYIVGGNA